MSQAGVQSNSMQTSLYNSKVDCKTHFEVVVPIVGLDHFCICSNRSADIKRETGGQCGLIFDSMS